MQLNRPSLLLLIPILSLFAAPTIAAYHKIGEDGNTRIPDETGNTHFAPGDKY